MTQQICPACQSENTYFSKKRQLQVCEDCEHGWEPATTALPAPGTKLKLFLSYGHDTNEELVCRVKADLEKRGHDVWFDKNKIKAGDDWRRAITEGIVSSNRVLSFLSKHSTRDPGVCLDEIAIAIGAKGGNIQTILVESQDEVNPPSTISHIQWLDMHDWKDGHGAVQISKGEPAKGDEAWEAWYQERFAEIVRVVESPENVRFAGEIEALKGHLNPISSDSRIYRFLKNDFVGRQWLADQVDRWRREETQSRVFWLTGAPGVGKSAFAAYLAHYDKSNIIALQFCEYDKPDHTDPRRIVCSLAFQLAARLPDYRKLLMSLPELANLERKNESELFVYLISEPMKNVIDGGRERCIIMIDALDEANEDSKNRLVDLLAAHIDLLPSWIGVLITSREESAVVSGLSMYNPIHLDTGTESNRSDLKDYLRRRLAPKLLDCADVDRVLDHIIDQSEGVFLYAEWVCTEINANSLSLDRLDEFPKGLGGIFRLFFNRQFKDQGVYETVIEPMIGAIISSRDPLPVDVLEKRFQWKETELRKWIRLLGSLFPIVQENGIDVIKPWHKSLFDWLSDEAQSKEFFVGVKDARLGLVNFFLENPLDKLSLRELPWLYTQLGDYQGLGEYIGTADVFMELYDYNKVQWNQELMQYVWSLDGKFNFPAYVTDNIERRCGKKWRLFDSLGTFYLVHSKSQGDLFISKDFLEKAYEFVAVEEPDREEFVELVLNNLGGLLGLKLHDYARAEQCLKKSLEISEGRLSKGHGSETDLAIRLNNLAVLFDSQGKYSEAEPMYRRALDIREDKLGKDHPHVASTLNNLAGLLESQGKYGEAEPMYRRALDIREDKLGKDHPDVASSLNSIAWNICRPQGRLTEAAELLKRAIRIWEENLGPVCADVITAHGNIGQIYTDMNAFVDAEFHLSHAMECAKVGLEPDHPETAIVQLKYQTYRHRSGKGADRHAIESAMAMLTASGDARASRGTDLLNEMDAQQNRSKE